MIDYRIDGYTVVYRRKGSASDSDAHFDTEEEALEFIQDCRHRWKSFKLIQYRVADCIEMEK